MSDIITGSDSVPYRLLEAMINGRPIRQTIEVEGDSFDDAREQAKSQTPEGFDMIAETIISDGKESTITCAADTIEEAFAEAESQIPANALSMKKTTVNNSEEHVIRVQEFDDQKARKLAEKKLTKTQSITSANLIKQGWKGVLRIGKKPNEYEFTIFQKAVAMVKYNVEKVKIRLVLGKKGECPKNVISSIKEGLSASDILGIIGRLSRLAFEYAHGRLGDKFNADEATLQMGMVMCLVGGRSVEGAECDVTFGGAIEMILQSIFFPRTKQAWIVKDWEVKSLISGEKHALVREFMEWFGLELLDGDSMLLNIAEEPGVAQMSLMQKMLDLSTSKVVLILGQTKLNELWLRSKSSLRLFARHYGVVRFNDVGFHNLRVGLIDDLIGIASGSVLGYSRGFEGYRMAELGIQPVVRIR